MVKRAYHTDWDLRIALTALGCILVGPTVVAIIVLVSLLWP